MNKNAEVSIDTGERVWKGPMEYFPKGAWLFGYPYYWVTKVDKMYYLWELDMNDPESGKYVLMEKNENGRSLEEKALKLDHIKFEEKKKMRGY